MADIALGSVEKIIKAGMAIKKAVVTARQNRVECKEIEELVATLVAILLLQMQNNQVMMNPPVINAALAGLERTLYRALELIKDCQESNSTLARRILGSSDMSKKLRRVKDDILQKMVLGTFATTVQVTMTLKNNIPYGGAHHLHAAAHPQDAEQVDVSYSGHFTTDDYGCGLSNGVRMAATGSEVCYATSSRSREMNLSELENISGGGGHRLVLREEIIIRVQTTCHKSQIRAMKLVAAVRGVESVTVARMGLLLVIGVGMDSDKLTGRLRRKVGLAEVVELRTNDCTETTISAAPKGMCSSLGMPSVFPLRARDDEDDLLSKPNPPLLQNHSQHLRRHPFVTGEAGSSRRNVHRPAWQRLSGSSSDFEEPQLSSQPSACAEGVKGKGKQMILAVQQHQKKVRSPHAVDADARPFGRSPRGFMADARGSMPPHQAIEQVDSMNPAATPVQRKKLGSIEHLRETTTDYRPGQQASNSYPKVHDDRVPFLRMYGIVFVFLFLFFFKVVIT